MDKKEILEMLEDDVFTVAAFETEYVDTNNGMLNEEYLNRRKKILLENSVSYLAEEVTKSTQGYPVNDVSEVKLELDLVVMQRKDLDAILKYIEEHD